MDTDFHAFRKTETCIVTDGESIIDISGTDREMGLPLFTLRIIRSCTGTEWSHAGLCPLPLRSRNAYRAEKDVCATSSPAQLSADCIRDLQLLLLARAGHEL